MSDIRHGPKLDSHEAEAFTNLEAEAGTLINLEAEALVTKPKPGYLYYTHLQKKSTTRGCISFRDECDWLQSQSFGKKTTKPKPLKITKAEPGSQKSRKPKP